MINMHKDLESILIDQEEIDRIVGDIAAQINKDYANEEIVLLVILKGSMIFASDLMRKLEMPVMLDFMQASSYGNGSVSAGKVKIKHECQIDIKDKNVIIVEDIIDSGNTLHFLKELLTKREPKTLKLCTLLDKPERRQTDVMPEYVGKAIPDEFVVGYGLDYAERYRDLPYIGVLAKRIYE